MHKEVQKASRRVEGQHFKQPDFEKEILLILSKSTGPLSSLELIGMLKQRMASKFSRADLEIGNRGRTRWENTARFAIYQGLKKRGLIEATTKNQWTITSKGRIELSFDN